MFVHLPKFLKPGTDSCVLGRGQALSVLLQALHPEDLGANRLVHLRRRDHDGVGGIHFQRSFRLYLTGIHLRLILLD